MNCRGGRGRALGAGYAAQARSIGRAKVCGSGGSEVRFVSAQGKDEGRRSAQSHACEHLGTPGSFSFTLKTFSYCFHHGIF